MKNYPDYVLIQRANLIDRQPVFSGLDDYRDELDQELESRALVSNELYLGDCAGEVVFVPFEVLNNEGQPVISEVVGYDNEGNEVWLDV